ncbi:MAG: hypothetical protein Q4D26_11590 [Clostridia bacterium]|nr:hypothetical protein [Clostridia bacterium]
MSDQIDKETEYLLSIVNSVQYNKYRFKLMCGNDRYVFGIVSGSNFNEPAPFSKLMQYKTFYDTLRDLDYKIKISFFKAIEYAYSDELIDNFSIFRENTTIEMDTYYFIENAMFRTSSLWDILAQLYRLYYNLDIEPTKVYYNKLFNPDNNVNDQFKEKAREIYNYIKQEDDTNCEGEWKGNHTFVNGCRNKMTHRNSPNVGVMSDFDINLKVAPTYMLKRLIEDYGRVSMYISEILYKIEKDELKKFDM